MHASIYSVSTIFSESLTHLSSWPTCNMTDITLHRIPHDRVPKWSGKRRPHQFVTDVSQDVRKAV